MVRNDWYKHSIAARFLFGRCLDTIDLSLKSDHLSKFKQTLLFVFEPKWKTRTDSALLFLPARSVWTMFESDEDEERTQEYHPTGSGAILFTRPIICLVVFDLSPLLLFSNSWIIREAFCLHVFNVPTHLLLLLSAPISSCCKDCVPADLCVYANGGTGIQTSVLKMPTQLEACVHTLLSTFCCCDFGRRRILLCKWRIGRRWRWTGPTEKTLEQAWNVLIRFL